MASSSITDFGAPMQEPSRWQRLADVALIVAVCFVVAGDVPPNVNEAHYLGRLKHYWNPSWCAGDRFLESTDTQVLFIWLFGWVTRLVSLAAAAWIGRFIAWTFFAWAWQRLSWRLVPRRFASVLSSALFLALNSYAHLAGEWVVGGVEAKCFAYPFVLLALRELLDGRWNYVWLMLGAATAFHPLVGGWSGVICAGIWLVDGRREQKLLSMLPGLTFGGLISLIGLIPALTLTRSVPPETVAESNRIYVFDRLPHHLAPLTLPREEATRRLTGHALLVAAFLIVTLLWRGWGRAGTTATVVGGPPASQSSPWRAGGSLTLDTSHAGPLRRIAMFAWGAIVLAAVGFAIEVALGSQPLVAAKLLRYYWFRLTDFAVPMAVAFYVVAILAEAFERRSGWATPLLFLAMTFAGWFLGSTAWMRYQNPLPPADNKVADYPSWVEVCEWIAENTPPDAAFLTPRLNVSFKWRTGRPEVVNRKDIPQDAAGIVEWSARVKDVFGTKVGDEETAVDSIGALGTDRVRELAKKYGAQYVLSDRGQLLRLPVAYDNEEYVVYKIDN
jgi:hypothetical protein